MLTRSVLVIEDEAVVALQAQFGIPDILLSGDPAASRRARKRGVTPITKPCTPEQLETVLAGAFAPSP